jgi:serine/threonine-protein kinase
VGREGDTDFLVMELVDGEVRFQARSRAGRCRFRKSCQSGAEIASALGPAHKNGIAHRDLKPAT